MAGKTPTTELTDPRAVAALCALLSRVVLQGWGATFRLVFVLLVLTACVLGVIVVTDLPELPSLLRGRL